MGPTSGPGQAGPPAEAPGPRWPWFLALLAVLAVAAGSVWAVRARPGRDGRASRSFAPRNARPGVRYVGDAACARCHTEIARTYREHPMGRSLLPIGEAPKEARGAAEERALFVAQGLEYSLQNRDGRTIHREKKRDSTGHVVGEVEGEVRYVLGSGTHARAFLIGRDDYLFQSPVTWYAQDNRWDLAPGYEARDAKFDRQVSPACLTCHANRVEHVEGTEGRYRPPTFRGHAIGCERCHGPGGLHPAQPDPPSGGAGDEAATIVNPARLEPALREAVCQQCHLIGVAAVARRGRTLTDYRPGLPLHEFETVFVRPQGGADDHPNGDHVEQMHQSLCFRRSGGALGCISCHDPHALPDPGERVAYYRERCLACHGGDRGCALDPLARQEVSAGDSCIECHMPRVGTSDVAHVATTHHGIVRHREAAYRPARPREGPPGGPSLVPFHRALMTEGGLRDTDRDLGIALRARGARFSAEALPLLERAHAEHPDDVPAWESVGFALWGVGRREEALGVFESVLKQEPDRESAVASAAQLAGALGQADRAVGLWRRAIALDPWLSGYHADLAGQLNRLEQWPEAAESASRSLRLNPSGRTARAALVLATLRSGDPEAARAQLATLIEYHPAEREALTRWFDGLRREAGGR